MKTSNESKKEFKWINGLNRCFKRENLSLLKSSVFDFLIFERIVDPTFNTDSMNEIESMSEIYGEIIERN